MKITGMKLAFIETSIMTLCGRKSRGPGGHLGPDKSRKPTRIKPPWRKPGIGEIDVGHDAWNMTDSTAGREDI